MAMMIIVATLCHLGGGTEKQHGFSGMLCGPSHPQQDIAVIWGDPGSPDNSLMDMLHMSQAFTINGFWSMCAVQVVHRHF